MTEIRAEAIWATALSHPLRVRVLRHLLHATVAQPVELARTWETTVDVMHRHFHRLRGLGVIERTDRPGARGRAAYRLSNRRATQEAFWRLGAPLPAGLGTRFAVRMSTAVQSRQTAFDRLRARREQLGISRPELSHRTGIHLDMLGRLERGQVDPRLSIMLVLADELDYPPEQLFAGAASPHAETCR